jgi:uncharacterized protein YigE (DUF2233 family)
MMRGLMVLMLLCLGHAAEAACRDMTFEDKPYSVCEVQAGQDLRLFLNGPNGAYGRFSAVDDELAKQGQHLAFAMNAGMFQPDLSPVGLYIENAQALTPLITSDGPGNFGLLPNGVFCIGERFSVIESRRFAKKKPSCRYATQSGPMLVINGDLHPLFKPGSDSLNFRNGVGVSADGKTAWFVISNRVVNFDSFARLFRDGLGSPNALYLDGSISRLYAPELGRSGAGFDVGPILGLVVQKAGN